MRYRDPFTGHFTTRAKYGRAVERVMRKLADAVNRDDDRSASKLRAKLDKYPPLARRTAARRSEPTTRQATARRTPTGRKAPRARVWEFGKSYKSPRRGKHDVNVNVRMRFDRPVTVREARDAMQEFIGGGAPDGVNIQAVQWNRPQGRSRSAGGEHFDNFRAIFYTEGSDFLRAGAVKDDEL